MRRRRKWRIAVGLSRILTWKLRNLVIGYTECDSKTAVLVLKRILAVVKTEAEKNKN
ncbi:hypothetical protein YC2023_047534 [Brassica napus]